MDPDSGAGKFATIAAVGTPSSGSNPVDAVFSNPLIWKKIGSYLNMVDLLACRLVNSEFHGMVMKETNFRNRCLVSLEPHQITSNIFGITVEPWKNVELKFGNIAGEGFTTKYGFGDDELEWLYPVLSNVESLNLRMAIGTREKDFYPILKRLLSALKKLRALAIEPIFLTVATREIQDWKDTFQHLQEFQVLEPLAGWQKDIWNLKTNEICSDSVLFAFVSELKNIRVFKSYYPAHPFMVNDEGSNAVRLAAFVVPVMLSRIVSNSTNTLKHVTFPEQGDWNQTKSEASFGYHPFGSLESAAFYLHMMNETRVQVVREYLLALPLLKELDFTVHPFMPSSILREDAELFQYLPSSILNSIGERSDRLRTLKIQSPDFKGTNWHFLKTTKIEKFQLQLAHSEEGETLPDEALSCLPPTVQKLLLVGPLASNPITFLARLNSSLVTELTFINSGDCFTDDTIKFIRENFKMLRLLNVTNAKRVTDAGFVSSSGSGSLSGIKGLKTLILNGCGSITNAAVREIRFLEVSHLELSDNKGVTQEGVQKMLQNNPSLSAGVKRKLRKRTHVHM